MQQELQKAKRNYTAQDPTKTPLVNFASKIIQALEAKDEANKVAEGMPESKASTKEAETPELTPPRNFKI